MPCDNGSVNMVSGKIYTVAEITKLIKELVEGSGVFAHVQIEGEVSNFRRYPSGHCYFSLKDKGGLLKAVMFAGSARTLKFTPKDGDKVYALGRIGVYERDGVYQLYVDMMLPAGAGSLMLAFEKLKNKLAAEGLFDTERKIALPAHPTKIGVITSSAGAAIKDIISVARRRNPAISLLLYPVRVQGAEAAGELVHAIEFMNKQELVDVLIIGRGGGSIEDLWAFNEEPVVRAIAASKLPIISAVGHEIDFTLADFAADMRAATPSQAAELAVPDATGTINICRQLTVRINNAMGQLLAVKQNKLERLCSSWTLVQPLRLLEDRQLQVDSLSVRLMRSEQDKLAAAGHRLSLACAKLNVLSPLAILGRGYSITTTINNKVVASVDAVQPMEELVTRVRDGVIHAQVFEIRKETI